MITRGWIVSILPSGYYVESRSFGLGSRVGPCQADMGNYAINDQVVLGTTDTSRDDVIILGKLIEGPQDEVGALPQYVDYNALSSSPNPYDGKLAWITSYERLYAYRGDGYGWYEVAFADDLNSREPAVPAGTTSQYYRGDKTWQTLNKAAVGLSNVDNTSDVNKPVSTAQATALLPKNPITIPASTDWNTLTTAGVYKVSSNTAITGMPNTPVNYAGLLEVLDISAAFDGSFIEQRFTAYRTATQGVATQYMRTYTGGAWYAWRQVSDAADVTSGLATKEPTITAGTTAQYWRGDKSWQTLNKAAVGLSNVDNTADTAKPVSTAQQSALDTKMGGQHFATFSALLSDTTKYNGKLGWTENGYAMYLYDASADNWRTVMDDVTLPSGLAAASAGTADLNLLKTTGRYYQNSSSGATTAKHYPLAAATGLLEVIGDTGASFIIQRYTTVGVSYPWNNSIFQRVYSSSTWSDWRPVYTDGTASAIFKSSPGTQTLTNSPSKINFDIMTTTSFNTVGATTAVATVNGTYMATAALTLSDTATAGTYFRCEIRQNSSVVYTGIGPQTTTFNQVNASGLLQLSVGDSVELYGSVNSATTRTVWSNASMTYLTLTRIGA